MRPLRALPLPQGYETPFYGQPPREATGCIVRVQLDQQTGAMVSSSRSAPSLGPSRRARLPSLGPPAAGPTLPTAPPPAVRRFGPHPLLRPSGITFSPQGHLLATTMARRLLVLAGPGAQQPGATLASYDTSSWWAGTPWDVACLRGGRVYVTMHNGDVVGGGCWPSSACAGPSSSS